MWVVNDCVFADVDCLSLSCVVDVHCIVYVDVVYVGDGVGVFICVFDGDGIFEEGRIMLSWKACGDGISFPIFGLIPAQARHTARMAKM